VLENAATAAVARREMEKSQVIHLALHSVLDEHFPLRSKLLFARTGKPAEDSLSAYDVYRMNLARTRLVVLSSCQTGAERYYKGEGMISLARPFIVAHVPLVVSTLWPVESDATAELMIHFHKHRTQEKISTAAALAEAQREMLAGADPQLRQPYYWAAFTLIGGYANF
jgi:CHAT domain-containing protein